MRQGFSLATVPVSVQRTRLSWQQRQSDQIKTSPELLKLAWAEHKFRWNERQWFPDRNQQLELALERFSSQLNAYVANRPLTTDYAARSKIDLLREFINEVPEIFIALRFTQPAPRVQNPSGGSSSLNLIYLQDLPVTFPQADGGSVARELGVDEALPYRKDTQIGR